MSGDELVQVNRALLRAGVPSGLAGVNALAHRMEQLTTQVEKLTARIEQLERYPVKEMDQIAGELDRISRITGENWRLVGYRGVANRVRVLLDQWSAQERENVALRRELSTKRSLEAAEHGLCECGHRLALVDVFDHDGVGHRLGNLLARCEIHTAEEVLACTDDELLRSRGMGMVMMQRLHDRIPHCNDPRWKQDGTSGGAE